MRRLANGLTAVVREVRTAPVVAVVTYVTVGYFDEPDDVVGISHVLEHMYFKGTARRGVGAIARETKDAGGYLNAATIYDHTSYYTVLPSESLERGLDIQADALLNSEVDAGELGRELEVIIQEANRKRDSPSAVAIESLYALMFETHRIRRWRMGTEEELRRLTRAHVHGYYRRFYQPSRIVLVVAGDVDAEHAFARIEAYYGAMEGASPPLDRGVADPEQDALRLRELTGDVLEAYLEIGWRTQPTLHADTPLLDLLALVLGQGRASRLYRNVRERRLVTGIGADNYAPTELGVFTIGAELMPGDAPAAVDAIFAEVARARSEPVAEGELERAKNVLEARWLRRLETAEGQANHLAEWQALGDWRLADAHFERALGASAADLQRVAREYLAPRRASVLLYRPSDSQPLPWDAAALEARLAAGAQR